MACHYCAHWIEGENQRLLSGKITENMSREVGICTLSPTWIETTGLHHCSQLRLTSSSYFAHYFRLAHDSLDQANAEFKKRRDIEKKLKETRRLLREAVRKSKST